MATASERTRLLSPEESQSKYIFDSAAARARKIRVRQFQCCIFAVLLVMFLVGSIIIIVYSITEDDLPNNSTDTESTTVALDGSTTPVPVLVLLSHTFPIEDVENENKTTDDTLLWEDAIEAGRNGLEEKENIEKNVPSLQMRSPSYRHQKVVATSEKGRNLSKIGFVEEYATRHIYRTKQNKTLVEKICHPNGTTYEEYCRKTTIECSHSQKYRTYNGTCNNLLYPLQYGTSYRPFRRSLPPDYADGISAPRKSKSGYPLPSARTVSLVVHRPYYRNDPKFSVMLAVWGQFLDHDITATALSQKSNGSSISCCDPQAVSSPECFPVNLDQLDPFREYNVSCIEFVRSAPAPTCCLGPREQLNQVTPFIDGSVIYGAEEDVTKKLRDMENGTMKVIMTADNRTLLPASDDLNDGCNREEEEKQGRYCFLTGDARANENLHLTSMHLIWVRQHNLIAANLSRLNPHWNDETIFQETRRIIGAQMQHITYNEFLHILLGNKLMEKFDLYPLKSGYSKTYNESLDPSIANSFAAASFRFAHSIIPGLMKLLENFTSTPEFIQMRKMLFNPFRLYEPGMLDKTLKGAMNTTIEASDSYFSNELKSHMFEKSAEKMQQPKLCGLDLVSLNVQRGRDHGLPAYTSWRTHCGLSRTDSFDDLKGDMDSYSLYNIKAIYRDVDDIDLYTGALSEIPLEGSILGPTITCLILDQFYRIKHGDRFWYENPYKPHAFSPEQLQEIKKTTLGNIICDNSDGLDVIQERVMNRVEKDNEYIPCSKVDRPNLNAWKEDLHRVDISGGSLEVKAIV